LQRPYICDFNGCTFKSATSGGLKSHKVTHTDVKNFHCDFPECGYKCRRSEHLKGHVKALHTIEGQARHKKEEEQIAKLFDIFDIKFKREHRISFDCLQTKEGNASYARIDFIIIMHARIYILEVDENQHRFGYEAGCDMRRMSRIVESLRLEGNMLPIIFIRYNPHSFSVDGKSAKVPTKVRQKRLISIIQDPLAIKTEGPTLSIQYMYYDSSDGQANVCNDLEYNSEIAKCCLPCIYD
jgi:hypothetical protein